MAANECVVHGHVAAIWIFTKPNTAFAASNEIEGVQNTVGFQFNEGSTGWYWMYGLSSDGATGFLLLITRFQTKGQGTAADSFYGLSGYVVQNHVAMPYSTYHTPVACPASYNATSDGVSMIFDLTDTRDDPNVMLAAVTFATQRERVAATALHATHTAEETQYNNGVAVLGRFAKVEILNVACGFPSLVGVTVQDGTRYLLKAVTDGRITVYNAALTLESLALLYVETKDKTTPTLVGVGAIEAIGVTNMKTDEIRKAALFAPYDASGLLALSTLSAKETPDTVAAIV